jgi:hypothetical protein
MFSIVSNFYPIVLPKVELSYIYKLQREPKEATPCFYFGECPMLQKIVMGSIKEAPSKTN